MIFETKFNPTTISYESTIKNLEKAQEILDQRLKNQQIDNDEYIKKSKDIAAQIEQYREKINDSN